MSTLYHYNQFSPAKLQWGKLIPLLSSTSAAIADYDGVLTAVPNADVLLSPLTTQRRDIDCAWEGYHGGCGLIFL